MCALCPKHTESVDFTPRKSSCAWCAWNNKIISTSHVLNQRVVYLERRVKSLAVCMPHMDKQLAKFYTKNLTFDAERQRLRCAWALKHEGDEKGYIHAHKYRPT